jgi:hypothetical protein
MFSRWIITNSISTRGTVHCRKTRILAGINSWSVESTHFLITRSKLLKRSAAAGIQIPDLCTLRRIKYLVAKRLKDSGNSVKAGARRAIPRNG